MKNYIAIDIGGTAIKYGLISSDGKVLERKSTPTGAELGGEHIRGKAMEIVANYLADAGYPPSSGKTDPPFAGICVSSTGMVDVRKGEIFYSGETVPDYTGTKFKPVFENAFGIPFEMENDVNCAGLAEYTSGAGQGSSSMLCLTVGTGIGGCAIIDGKVLHGATGSACEVGYMHMGDSDFQMLGSTGYMCQKVARRKGSAQGQDNSAALHSTASEAQALQSGEEDNDRDQELILYDDDDFQDSVYAEDEEQPEEEGESIQTAAVDENGSYTTKDDVALYIHTYGKLPPNFITKKEAQKLGWSGGSLEPYAPGKCIGGNYFGNYEGVLPDGNYRECDIDTLGKKSRGAKRIIYSDDGRIYYTDDHYKSFTQLY